jgi:branched-chain amino acid transport system permease protein
LAFIPFSLFFASILSAIVGITIDRLVYLPLRNSNAPGLVFLIASFGVFIFIQNFLQLLYGAQILTLRTGPVVEGHQIMGAVITDIQIMLLVVSGLLLAALWAIVDKTKMWKAIRAVADDSEFYLFDEPTAGVKRNLDDS